MAVAVRLRSRNAPARMRGAMFTICPSVRQATGNWDHRVRARYGTDSVPAPLPHVAQLYPVPPGPTPGHSAATGPFLYPTWSDVKPSLPRLMPWAGAIPHGIPGVTATPAIPASVFGKPITHRAPRAKQSGGGQGRVTVQPKPTPPWKRQGQRATKVKHR